MDYDGTNTTGIVFGGKLTLPAASQRWVHIFSAGTPGDGTFLYAGNHYAVSNGEGFGIPIIRDCSITGVAVIFQSITDSGWSSGDYVDFEIGKGTDGSTSTTNLFDFRLGHDDSVDTTGGIAIAGDSGGDALTAQATYAQGTYALSAGNYLKVKYNEQTTFTASDVLVSVEVTYDTDV